MECLEIEPGEDLCLPSCDEPRELKTRMRRVLETAPSHGEWLLHAGDWIAAPLWMQWEEPLLGVGMDAERFRRILVGYRQEIRLWVVGERPWDQCVSGLAGRVMRRIVAPRSR